MKRSNTNGEMGSKNSKGRIFDGVGDSGINGDEEEIVTTENRGVDSVQLDKSARNPENTILDKIGNLNLDGQEENKKFDFDLNLVPADDIAEVGTNYSRRKGKEPLINEKEIIDIPSDDSDYYKTEYNGPRIGIGKRNMDLMMASWKVDSSSEEEEDGVDVGFGSNRDNPIEINDENSDHGEVEPLQLEALPMQLQPEALPIQLQPADLRESEWRIRNRLKFARPLGIPTEDSKIESCNKKHQGSGPFFEALKKISHRTSNKIVEELIELRGSTENRERRIFVPSLRDLSLKVLAENFESIDFSQRWIPDNLRIKLADVLCDMGKMNGCALNLFVTEHTNDIRIRNCSLLTEEEFQNAFQRCYTENLRVLRLDLCGKCMNDITLKNIARDRNSLSKLAIVSFRGAFRLSDNGIKELVISAPKLQSINLGQCNSLTGQAIHYIAELGINLRELYIDGCVSIDPMHILSAIKKLTKLEVLSVAGIITVTDKFIVEVISFCGQNIKELNLASCVELTDNALKIIGSNCDGLCALNISNLQKLTDLGLEFLANGCRSIQKLKLLRNEFSDEAMAAFLETSGESLVELSLNGVKKVGLNTALSLAKCSKKLLYLDISWCRKISLDGLGSILDNCSSLKLLKVFGCTQITKQFLSAHSNSVLRIIGSVLSPLLEHIYLLEPEEMFLRYSPMFPESRSKEFN